MRCTPLSMIGEHGILTLDRVYILLVFESGVAVQVLHPFLDLVVSWIRTNKLKVNLSKAEAL